VRRGNEEKENLEGQIAELQASLGHAHRDLQQREIDLNEHVKSTVAQELKQRHEGDMQALKLRHEADMQELKLRLEADISAIQRAHEEVVAELRRVNDEGVSELRRVNDAAISVLKAEHTEKISDMRAKLDYEVENKTLQLKIQLFECKADLEAARKAETGAQEILTAARAREERLHSEISSKMLEIMALRASFEEELKSLRNSLEEPLSKLEKETAAKSMTIDTLEADLEEARKSLADRERDFKELQAEEEKIRAEHFLSLQAEHKQREDERKGWEAKRLQTAHDIENMKSDLIEKDAIIDKYLLLVEDLRQELDTTRTDFQSIQAEKMKIQEENVVVRGAIRRKDDERQKIDAENLELLEIIRRKDQEIGQAYDKCRTLVSEAKTELDEKNSIIEKLKSDVLAIETLAKQSNHKRLEEKEEVERKLDLEKRDLLREVEHSNLVLAQKLKDISSLELEVESLKQELKELRQLHEEELKQLNDQIRFHQDDLDLKDQELIDFKGKHVAVVEALQLDLRKAQQDFTRLEAINKEVQTQLSNQKEQIATLRKMEALVLSKDQTIKELERAKETIVHELNGELVSTQEQVDALQKQIENLNHEIQDLQSDLEREVSAHEPLKKELVLLRGEVRRKGDQLSKMEESHGKIHVKMEELHNTSHERPGGQQDELEGLWRALTRKEEEISDLKNSLASAQSKIEDLQNTERKFKELKTMMRGKVQLEKRDLVVSTVKTRKVEDQISSLVQQIALERSRRQQLQLSWASLESAISIMCPRLAEARFHLVFTAKQSLFENEVNNDGIHVRGPMYLWLRGMFAHALGVDSSAIRSLSKHARTHVCAVFLLSLSLFPPLSL
jgi:chromosome segregation ATPase